ncbi:unnamed protein product [Blepharisma stoltei]|uniref:Association with the SNF1 complex (ASC) domain-containing protein n=1 Tax=Blepharisma stoltei TaxID=1481888 RepID=A0AAU9KBA7_9CILI|nr:unnamed protein product [Blepharisma stoltei]
MYLLFNFKMGSQTSRHLESSQTNSFIHGFEEERTEDRLNLEDTSRESSLASSLTENDNFIRDPNIVTYTFKWNNGGKEVSIVGAFNDWKEIIQMERRGNEFALDVLLKRDTVYDYKFLVDGEWRFANEQPIKRDPMGNVNNWIDTNALNEEEDGTLTAKNPEKYSQDFYADLTTMDPDPLPLHLCYVLANHSGSFDYRQKDTVPSNSPIHLTNAELAGENNLPVNELPIPSHVILNHVGIRANERVIGLTTTQRYREKYVTTIYYKPIK